MHAPKNKQKENIRRDTHWGSGKETGKGKGESSTPVPLTSSEHVRHKDNSLASLGTTLAEQVPYPSGNSDANPKRDHKCGDNHLQNARVRSQGGFPQQAGRQCGQLESPHLQAGHGSTRHPKFQELFDASPIHGST